MPRGISTAFISGSDYQYNNIQCVVSTESALRYIDYM